MIRKAVYAAVFALILTPSSAFALSTDYTQYLPEDGMGAVMVTCNDTANNFAIYNTSAGLNWGTFDCASSVFNFSSVSEDDNTYAILEFSSTNSCEDKNYTDCANSNFIVAEVQFTVGSTLGTGPNVSPTFAASKTAYGPGENAHITCSYSRNKLQLYDVTQGLEVPVADGGNMGNFSCTAPPTTVSFQSTLDHTYKVIELAPGQSCAGMSVTDCRAQSFARGELSFTVQLAPGIIRTTHNPTIDIISPREGAVFSHRGLISYRAADKNDLGNADERELLGLRSNPVVLYFTDKIAEWEHTIVETEDKTLIAENQPAAQSYQWHITNLIPGVLYRVVVDAFDKAGVMGESVSESFFVDFDAPEFVVEASPAATRGEPVTLKIIPSKELRGEPTVEVTQQGSTSTMLKLEKKEGFYEGVYEVLSGYDGIARISVSGTDRAGNVGSTMVSGGTFAVGVEPPPQARLTLPRNNEVVSSNAITVSGTAREDTTVILTVNGTTTYETTPQKDGTFSINDVRLRKEVNRGVNTLSVVLRDQAGIVGEPVALQVKYNIPPTVAHNIPAENATLSNTAPLEVSAKDENNDPLLFTYQIIPFADFNPDAAATSTNGWVTIADAIPASRFSWNTTDVEDGKYMMSATVDDGLEKAYTPPRAITVRNTSPFFRFEDGRKTITSSSTVTIIGRALTPATLLPRPMINKIEYSRDNGATWKDVPLGTGENLPDVRFSVTFSQLAEGTHGVMWRATDDRNLAGRASHPIIVDATAPATPTISVPHAGVIITDEHDMNMVRDGVQPLIVGRAESQSTITLIIGSTTRTAKTSVTGQFSFRDVDIQGRGDYSFSLVAADQAGNRSAAAQGSFVYDNPPKVTILSPKSSRALRGQATVRWSISDPDGDAIASTTLSFKQGSGTFKKLPIDPTQNSFAWDVSGLPQGTGYQLKLEASDGVVVAQDVVDFFVDTAAPSLISLLLSKTILGKTDTLEAKGEAQDALSGVEFVEYALAENGQTPQSTDWFTALITRGFLQKRAHFSITHPTKLSDGKYQLFARAVDAAGNSSVSRVEQVLVDTMPPHIGSFSISTGGMRIAPDQSGVIAAYPMRDVTFEISLEEDTARASVSTEVVHSPLTKNISNGLWEAMVQVPEMETPILISAEDAVHNEVVDTQIGLLKPLARGHVTVARDDGTRDPVPEAQIQVLVLDEGSGNFVPFADRGVAAGGIVTVSDGTYELALPEGVYRLIARKEGIKTTAQDITLERAGFVNISFTSERLNAFFNFIQDITDYFQYRF